ncbi:Uncharacterised protein [uncultured archaeon]|nr:Uncharacterised protein [uncultured archaeon]
MAESLKGFNSVAAVQVCQQAYKLLDEVMERQNIRNPEAQAAVAQRR